MSDPFFQKKRKRTGPSADGAGPSRLRMRDRTAAGGGGRVSREVGQGKRTAEEDESGDEEEGGLEAMDTLHRYEDDVHESDEEQTETPAEARVRLAKLYLDSLRDGEIDPNDVDAAEIDRQNLNSRLQADASTHSTHVHNFVADRLVLPASMADTTNILACRGHRLSVTSAVLSADFAFLWSASKDGSMIRWRLHDGKMLERIDKSTLLEGRRHVSMKASKSSGAARRRARSAATREIQASSRTTEQGHNDEVWSLSASQDGQYLVSGGKDRRICVWRTHSGAASDDEPTTFVKALGGHKDSITGVRFRHGTHDLFSVSLDRTMKLFDVSQLSYVETFFGHQEEIADMDILRAELAVSAGSRDRTVRWWKVRDESQLVFRGGAKSRVREILEGGDIADEEGPTSKETETHLVEGSVESVAMIDDHTFLSGGDSGTISLWSLAKKKPIFSVSAAHGFDDDESASASSGKAIRKARWITSLACLPYGDLFASGSWDGSVRLWKLTSSLKSFTAVCHLPAAGFINSLQLVSPSRAIIKQRGGALIDAGLWQRKGGLKGGPMRVFQDLEVNGKENGNRAATADARQLHTMVILVVGLGQEHKRGRWQRIRDAHNGTLVIPFQLL